MVRTIVLSMVALLALAGAVSACPYSAQNDTGQTTTTSQVPLPTDTTTDKTGG